MKKIESIFKDLKKWNKYLLIVFGVSIIVDWILNGWEDASGIVIAYMFYSGFYAVIYRKNAGKFARSCDSLLTAALILTVFYMFEGFFS